ncbi:MAG: sugar ABC transporter permease [Ruminococcaceae bacterium]|jgi:ABC-type sugar transport system permease subunit|nr:sugar ABC transporter permease [Oscillospiraceae bacterium]MEE1074634.1 sugar ABC transporter permease [Acutalibacteraceae bacterium]
MANQSKMTLKTKEKLMGVMFMLPWILGLLIFSLYPLFYSIWLSFANVEFSSAGISTDFVGIKWYKELFTEDPNFITNMVDTLKSIVFSAPMIIVASIILALLLNKALPGRAIFRALYFFPVIIISGPVMSKLINNQATSIIHPDQYSIYTVIENMPDIISVPLTYIFDNIVIILWYSGVQMLIILTGLQKIGDSIYEAASIDGAGSWEKFWKITLPYLRPMILVSSAYTVVDLASMSTTPIHAYIEKNVTNILKPYSYSSAISWLYALAILAILGIVFFILRERRAKLYAK